MNHQDLINTFIFEQIQELLFSDLSGPLILCLPLQYTSISGLPSNLIEIIYSVLTSF